MKARFIMIALGVMTAAAPVQAQSAKRVSYESFSPEAKALFDTCEAIEKQIAAKPTREERLPVARNLFTQSAALVVSEPGSLRGWIWRGLSGLLLENREATLQAIDQILTLGRGAGNNPQVARIFEQAKAKGWVGVETSAQETSTVPSGNASPWIFVDSSERLLTRGELAGLHADTLWRARNEIYARNGLIFSTPRGKAFAASLGAFYRGANADQGAVTAAMNPIEVKNVALIKSLE